MSLSEQLKQRIAENTERANRAAAEKIKELTEPYMPYKTGNLMNSMRVADNNIIEVTAEYSEEVLNPTTPREYDTSVHPLATGYPFDASEKEHEQEIIDAYIGALLSDE